MTFSGRVQLRSSGDPLAGSGPPGESEVQRLNPEREVRILKATGWQSLAPGSLNLEVHDQVLDDLGQLTPVIREPGSEVIYPSPFQHIPNVRREYWYYRGVAWYGESRENVLVRRAAHPVPGRVELFAAIHLGERFGLKAGDSLRVEVVSAPTDAATGA